MIVWVAIAVLIAVVLLLAAVVIVLTLAVSALFAWTRKVDWPLRPPGRGQVDE